MRITGPDGLEAEVVMVDSDGRVTDDPAEAVWGEITEYNERGVPIRRHYYVNEPAPGDER